MQRGKRLMQIMSERNEKKNEVFFSKQMETILFNSQILYTWKEMNEIIELGWEILMVMKGITTIVQGWILDFFGGGFSIPISYTQNWNFKTNLAINQVMIPVIRKLSLSLNKPGDSSQGQMSI